MIDHEQATNLAAAALGRDAQDFLSSELGRYLFGKADKEAGEALEALATADPANAKQIEALQSRIWRARSFRNWLYELVAIGQQAEMVLEQMDSAD